MEWVAESLARFGHLLFAALRSLTDAQVLGVYANGILMLAVRAGAGQSSDP